MTIEFHPLAEEELEDSADYYEKQNARSGAEFRREIQRVLDGLLKNPAIGATLPGGLRQYSNRRVPYRLIYSVKGDLLFVVAVAHQSRKPNYWRDRV